MSLTLIVLIHNLYTSSNFESYSYQCLFHALILTLRTNFEHCTWPYFLWLRVLLSYMGYYLVYTCETLSPSLSVSITICPFSLCIHYYVHLFLFTAQEIYRICSAFLNLDQFCTLSLNSQSKGMIKLVSW